MSRTTLLLTHFWNSALKEPGCTARDQGELGVAECELFLELCFELACCELGGTSEKRPMDSFWNSALNLRVANWTISVNRPWKSKGKRPKALSTTNILR